MNVSYHPAPCQELFVQTLLVHTYAPVKLDTKKVLPDVKVGRAFEENKSGKGCEAKASWFASNIVAS